uniref:Copper-containing nitrite reductase n=1 Tax=Bursaphelenchus xylophilus TaxID=6326 RepID=A0A1I7SP21_BURXY
RWLRARKPLRLCKLRRLPGHPTFCGLLQQFRRHRLPRQRQHPQRQPQRLLRVPQAPQQHPRPRRRRQRQPQSLLRLL